MTSRPSLEGWIEAFDPSFQRYYYFNPKTEESSWFHPRDQKLQAQGLLNEDTQQQGQQQPESEVNNNNSSNGNLTLPSRQIATTTNTNLTKSSSFNDIEQQPKSINTTYTRSTSTSVPSSPLVFGNRGAKKKFVATLSQQYHVLHKKIHTLEKEKNEDLNSFHIFDKFLLLHLSALTSIGGVAMSPTLMEKEFKANELLFNCFRGRLEQVKSYLAKKPEKLAEVLPSAKLSVLQLAVVSGNEQLVEFLLTAYSFNTNYVALNGLSSLHLACLFGLTNIIKLLLKSGAKHDAVFTGIPKYPPTFGIALQYWNKTGVKVGNFTPFLLCIFSGSLQALKCLLESPVDTEQFKEGNITDALSLACIMQSEEIVKFFLQEPSFKYNVDISDDNGMSPLMFVSLTCGSSNICSMLINKGASINGINRVNGFTCIHFAICNGFDFFIRQLCKEKKGTEELAVLLIHCNPKQNKTPLQLLYSDDLDISGEVRRRIEFILKSSGAQEKRLYSEIIKEGFLVKQGHVVKNWKKRWFVLRRGVLQYFKSVQKLKDAAGNINLSGARMARLDVIGGFTIYDSKGDKKYNIMSTAEEIDSWMEAIQFCINEAK
ncbi:hypothetical protein ABK040_008420 [Willaertia magna]